MQKDFVKELKRVADFDESHLVMLCGSVGDGKSHLLAYLSTEYPELLSKFKVHNDATESFDPDKNAIDTLADVLSSFNDYNIESSSEKRILAINLGVLNNFLESEYASENYTKLKSYIDDANIFESKFVSKNIIQDKVSFITFSDYHLFELNDDVDSNYVSSKYISSLMGRITNKVESNPFYRAYLKDKEQNYVNPLIYNYEMLSNENVQKVIIDILIKIFIKYRKIVSTRDLLNFIYELIVPPEIEDYDNFTNIEDFLNYLLPNMIFNSPERSNLLRLFSQFDPTLIRKEELDNFIIDLNINEDLKSVVSKYFDLSKLAFLEDYIDELGSLYEFDPSKKKEIISTIIRFALFYGKPSIKKNFVDETYLNFLKYLHAYNVQNTSEYKGLFKDIKDAICMWRGYPKKNYL
ncbi:MAG: DNA phosphorothioation-dependent restriction protein DptF, partial [archaeon]|nr:DNA phosphorothioation-dependent restriction protein DptF [archaeon]